MADETKDELLGAAAVCELLKIDRSTLSRWVAAGRIEYALKMRGVRGPFLFTRAQVEAVKRP